MKVDGRIQIGMRFKKAGDKREYTVLDIYKTYNSKNELVMVRYVAECKCLGQVVTDYDVPAATIIRGMM